MEHWFDNLTRITLGGQSRRDVLRGVISFAAAAMTRPLPGFASTEQVVVPAQYMPTASSTSCNGGRSHPYAGGCSIGGDADERIIKIYMARKMHKDTISIDQTITLRQQSVAEETRIRHSWFGPIVEITTTRGPGEPVLLRLRLGPIMSGFQEMSLVTEDGKHFTGKIDGRDLAPFSITQGKQQLRFTDGTLPRTPVYPSGLNEAVKTLYENARKEIYSCITKSKWSDREDRHPANLGSFAGSSLAAAGFMGARSEALLSEFSLIPHFGEETTERHRPSGTPNSTILAANEGRYDCPHETQFYSNPKQHADCQHCIEACYATAAACAALGCTVIPLFGCAIGAPLFCSAADIACLEVCNHAAFPVVRLVAATAAVRAEGSAWTQIEACAAAPMKRRVMDGHAVIYLTPACPTGLVVLRELRVATRAALASRLAAVTNAAQLLVVTAGAATPASPVIRHCRSVVRCRVGRNVASRDRSAAIPKGEFALLRDR